MRARGTLAGEGDAGEGDAGHIVEFLRRERPSASGRVGPS